MIKIKNKFLGVFLVGILSISSISGAVISKQDVNIVYAAESKALRDAKAKVNKLITSLKTNYLGLKNQGTWQLYIKQSRDLINRIPKSEKSQKDSLTAQVNKSEALVNGLARINQVEKSISINAKTIGNAETWSEYLRLAKIDLAKVDQSVFKKQYDELVDRMNKVSILVKEIEDKFKVEYDKVVNLYNKAKSSNDINKVEEVLYEAEKLGTCERSNKLEKDIKALINKYSPYTGYEILYSKVIDVDGDNKSDKIRVLGYSENESSWDDSPYADEIKIVVITSDGKEILTSNEEFYGYLDEVFINDFNKDGKKEIAVIQDSGGTNGGHSVSIYEINGNKIEYSKMNLSLNNTREKDYVRAYFLDNYKVKVFSPTLGKEQIISFKQNALHSADYYTELGEAGGQGPFYSFKDIDNDGAYEIVEYSDIDGSSHGETLGGVETYIKFINGEWKIIDFKAWAY